MAVTFPQADLPRGVGGGRDVWDSEAGALLSEDYFEASAPEAAAGGFASPIALWPYAFGEATTAALELVQTGNVAVSGTVSTTGNLSWNVALTQSGVVGVSGSISASGDLTITTPSLVLAQSGAVAVSGSLSTTGSIGYNLALSQSGQVGVSGSISTAGDLTYSLPSLELTQSGAVAVAGVLATTGAIGYALSLSQSGQISVNGSLSTTGDLTLGVAAKGFASFVLWPYSLGAAAESPFELAQSGSVAISGAVTTTGDVGAEESFELAAPLEMTPITGAMSVSGDLSIGAAASLSLVQSGAVAMAGAVSTSGNIGFNLGLTQTGAVAVSGALSASGDIGAAVALTAGSVGVSGALSVSGGLTITPGVPFELQQSGSMSISGAVSTFGDVLATETPIVIPGVGFQDFAAAGWLDKKEKPRKTRSIKAPKAKPAPIAFVIEAAPLSLSASLSADMTPLEIERVFSVRGLWRSTPDAAAYPKITRDSCPHCGAPVAHRHP